MEIVIKGDPKEIAALVLAVQGRHEDQKTESVNEREALICEYERRIAELKRGALPGDVILQI